MRRSVPSSLWRLAALSVPVLVALAACGDDSTDSTSSTPSSPSLDGREFLSTEAAEFELVAGSVIRLGFDEGNLSASGGCNQMFGGYSIDGDVLVADTLGMTEMACDAPLMDQDQRLVEFLTSKPTVQLDGDTLVLTSGSSSITFLDRVVADPDRPLEGTRWVVDTVIDGDSASTIPIGAVASMTIIDGVAQVEAGCNTGSASVTIAADTITFGPLALTRKACTPELMQLEAAVTATLSGEVSYTIEAARLTLTKGTNGLGFTAA